MNGCVFCAIVAGTADPEPADLLHHQNGVVSFTPLAPHVPGHRVFVPEQHVEDATTDPWLTGYVMSVSSRWVRGQQGQLLTSVGPDATQTVFHLHLHWLPRGPHDGLQADWPWLRLDA